MSRIDWPLLVMFAGLFIEVHAFEVHVVHSWDIEGWTALRDSPVVLVSGLSVLLSNSSRTYRPCSCSSR
jgi:hypothetical protein